MTRSRPTRPDLAREVDALREGLGPPAGQPSRVVMEDLHGDGEEIVTDLGGDGPEIRFAETVVETDWTPSPSEGSP